MAQLMKQREDDALKGTAQLRFETISFKKKLQMTLENPTSNFQWNPQKESRSRTSKTKQGRILKQKQRQTQVNFNIVVFNSNFLISNLCDHNSFHYNVAVEIEMDPIPNQHQEENIENITDPELERIEGENI